MNKIYITHCSAKKDESFQNSGKKVTPDLLYTATPTQRFMQICKQQKVNWAIFSDLYGVVFPQQEIEWYEKHPNSVSNHEFQVLLENIVTILRDYDEILFYNNPGRFHPLYRRLIDAARKRGINIKYFSHIWEIKK